MELAWPKGGSGSAGTRSSRSTSRLMGSNMAVVLRISWPPFERFSHGANLVADLFENRRQFRRRTAVRRDGTRCSMGSIFDTTHLRIQEVADRPELLEAFNRHFRGCATAGRLD